MVLTILIAWIALGALAVFFVYCCSRVSNGPRRELADDEYTDDPASASAARSAEARLRDSRESYSAPTGSTTPRMRPSNARP
jgi:hypothetical protein